MRLTLTLPLLTKELTEQSARRRTFVLRTVYAALLYGGALFLFGWQVGWQDGSFSMLGTGGRLFEAVLYFQIAAVYALVPVQTAGVLTSEKERDTLGLLLITRLEPWAIILEKYYSRVIPMLLHLLMSLPLLAVAYSLGGVETGSVLRAGIALTVCVLQVAALAVFCSAWCRTTSQALVMTYVILAAAIFAVTLVLGTAPWNVADYLGRANLRLRGLYSVEFSWHLLIAAWPAAITDRFPTNIVPDNVVIRSAPALIFTFVSLLMARLALWSRAFIRPKNRMLKLLQFIDGVFHRLNQNRFTKGKVLIHEHVTLPWDKPITWRETSRRSFGTTRYLVRLLLAIEVPLLFWLILPLTMQSAWAGTGSRNAPAPGEREQWVVWWLGTMLILAQSTSLIAGERSRQTLEVLLSTPLSPRDIVRQKMAGLWRLMAVLAVPFATAVIIRVWWVSNTQFWWQSESAVLSVLMAGFAVLVYWPLIALVGFECGLWCRTQLQAMSVALLLVLAVAAATVVIPRFSLGNDWTTLLAPLAPFSQGYPRPGYYVVPGAVERQYAICTHMAIYIGAACVLWRLAPRDFARAVCRCEAPS